MYVCMCSCFYFFNFFPGANRTACIANYVAVYLTDELSVARHTATLEIRFPTSHSTPSLTRLPPQTVFSPPEAKRRLCEVVARWGLGHRSSLNSSGPPGLAVCKPPLGEDHAPVWANGIPGHSHPNPVQGSSALLLQLLINDYTDSSTATATPAVLLLPSFFVNDARNCLSWLLQLARIVTEWRSIIHGH